MAYENTLLRKQLNSIQFVGLKGIKVGDALPIDTWHFMEWTKETISNFEFVKIPEYDCRIKGEKVDKAFVFSYAHIKREDQLQKFHVVEKLFDNRMVIMARKEKRIRNSFLCLIPLWYAQMGSIDYPSTIKYGICYKLCEALGHAGYLLKIIKKMHDIKKIIFFFDILAIDNILVQMCNQRNYITYTLQHGIINGTYDYVEYKCSHAKYFLAWGEYTKWVAMKYGMQESKIKVVGSMNQMEEDIICELSEEKQHHCFLVCTNGVDEKSAWSRNKEIIQIANKISEKFRMKYYLRVHPYDNASRYQHVANRDYCVRIVPKTMKISEALKKVDFTLCGNSTAFCDSLYHKVPAFRYITDRDKAIDVCKGIGFGRVKNYEESEKKLARLKADREFYQERSEKVRERLFCTENVAEKYVQAIEGKEFYVVV